MARTPTYLAIPSKKVKRNVISCIVEDEEIYNMFHEYKDNNDMTITAAMNEILEVFFQKKEMKFIDGKRYIRRK